MKKTEFVNSHKVGGWCKMPSGKAKMPALKFGRLDVPKAIDNRCYCTAIEDQGSKPWCAAYTAAAFAENVLWRRDGKIRQVETEPIYRWAKAHDGDPNGDGTTLNAVLDALLAKKIFQNPCKVKTIWSVLDKREDVKAAVHRFGCVLAGFNITTEWYDLANGCKKSVKGSTGNSLGGHAVLICGYDEGGVWIENSWGESWGEKGFGYIEWSAFDKQFVYGAVLTNCLNDFR